MIVHRWLAPITPSKAQIEKLLQKEGLGYFEENFSKGSKVTEHRHPFDELRVIIKGRMLYNVSGNKVLLRPGDKIIIPSNTLHSKEINDEDCFSLCSYHIH